MLYDTSIKKYLDQEPKKWTLPLIQNPGPKKRGEKVWLLHKKSILIFFIKI